MHQFTFDWPDIDCFCSHEPVPINIFPIISNFVGFLGDKIPIQVFPSLLYGSLPKAILKCFPIFIKPVLELYLFRGHFR